MPRERSKRTEKETLLLLLLVVKSDDEKESVRGGRGYALSLYMYTRSLKLLKSISPLGKTLREQHKSTRRCSSLENSRKPLSSGGDPLYPPLRARPRVVERFLCPLCLLLLYGKNVGVWVVSASHRRRRRHRLEKCLRRRLRLRRREKRIARIIVIIALIIGF